MFIVVFTRLKTTIIPYMDPHILVPNKDYSGGHSALGQLFLTITGAGGMVHDIYYYYKLLYYTYYYTVACFQLLKVTHK